MNHVNQDLGSCTHGPYLGPLGRGLSGLGVADCPAPFLSLHIHSLTPLPLPPQLPSQAGVYSPHLAARLCFPRFWQLPGPIRGPELLSPVGLLHSNRSSPGKTRYLAGCSLLQSALSCSPLHPPGPFEEYLPARAGFILRQTQSNAGPLHVGA